MASKIIIQTKDGKPESGVRRVSLIDYQSKSLIEERSVSFTNGYAEIESFLIDEGDELLVYSPESDIFGASIKAVVNEQASAAWGVGEPTVLHTVLVAGQSLSVGVASSAVNTDSPFGGFMFNGIRAEGKGDNVAQVAEMESLRPYQNDLVESHGYSFIQLFRSLEKSNDNRNNPVLWASTGVGGKTADWLFDTSNPSMNNAGRFITRSDLRAADIGLGVSLPFWLWDQGESDTNTDPDTYKTTVRAGHDYVTSLANAKTGQSRFDMILTGIGSGIGRREINNALYQYALENDDAHYAGSKWYISYKYPASSSDTTHMKAQGYMMQGEYHALAAHRLMQSVAAGDNPPVSKCLQPESYSVSGTIVTIAMYVPVPPMVIDTTTIPQLTGWGFKYISPTNVETVATSVNVSGNNLIVDFGVQLEEGGVLDFGYSDTQLGTPALNVRDSQSIPSIVDGETLYNWFPVFYHALAASEVA